MHELDEFDRLKFLRQEVGIPDRFKDPVKLEKVCNFGEEYARVHFANVMAHEDSQRAIVEAVRRSVGMRFPRTRDALIHTAGYVLAEGMTMTQGCEAYYDLEPDLFALIHDFGSGLTFLSTTIMEGYLNREYGLAERSGELAEETLTKLPLMSLADERRIKRGIGQANAEMVEILESGRSQGEMLLDFRLMLVLHGMIPSYVVPEIFIRGAQFADFLYPEVMRRITW